MNIQLLSEIANTIFYKRKKCKKLPKKPFAEINVNIRTSRGKKNSKDYTEFISKENTPYLVTEKPVNQSRHDLG